MLKPKQIAELNFWSSIRDNGIRGFSSEEWRTAHIHFKQYSLMYINRDIGYLRDKVVVEVGCGPAGIIPYVKATRAIGVDQLMDEYRKMWDLSGDEVEYICSEIETFDFPVEADVVICWNVFDHVRDINLAVKKLFDMVKSDGELWFMINLEDATGSWKVVEVNPETAHPYRVNIVSLSRLLKKHGFVWKEKVIMKNCLTGQDTILMGVLGKRLTWEKGLSFSDILYLTRLKSKHFASKLRGMMVK